MFFFYRYWDQTANVPKPYFNKFDSAFVPSLEEMAERLFPESLNFFKISKLATKSLESVNLKLSQPSWLLFYFTGHVIGR